MPVCGFFFPDHIYLHKYICINGWNVYCVQWVSSIDHNVHTTYIEQRSSYFMPNTESPRFTIWSTTPIWLTNHLTKGRRRRSRKKNNHRWSVHNLYDSFQSTHISCIIYMILRTERTFWLVLFLIVKHTASAIVNVEKKRKKRETIKFGRKLVCVLSKSLK